jgi:RNA polymerase sigma-70 factor (ECF subfamily)
MPSPDLPAFASAHRALLARVCRDSRPFLGSAPPGDLIAALHRSVRHRFPDGAGDHEVAHYLDGLHVDDLALACACRAGDEQAWEHFIRECRPSLYAAARHIGGDEAREIADGLYGELFGTTERDGERRSLFDYYHGRSRLTTWLRSVLVQRYIDRRRATARLDPLDDRTAAAIERGTLGGESPDPDRERYVTLAQSALDHAVSALTPRDRLRLRLYYGENLRLAQVGRVLGEHEATVSRKLERSRRELRAAVEAELRETHQLGDRAVRECMTAAAEAPELQLTHLLSRADDG